MFADGTSLFIGADVPNIAAEVLNSDLDKIKLWADQWLVKFSTGKTRLMTCSFRSVDHPDIVFKGIVLPEVDTHKYLGFTLSSNLSWSSHIDTILGSVSPVADVLRKLKYSVDKESLEQIYFIFIRPKLEYGYHIWDNCDKGDKKKRRIFN